MKTEDDSEIIEKVLYKFAGEDGWCNICHKGLETGENYCEDCKGKIWDMLKHAVKEEKKSMSGKYLEEMAELEEDLEMPYREMWEKLKQKIQTEEKE